MLRNSRILIVDDHPTNVAILEEILAQSGNVFQPTEVEIDAIEALIPPVVVGVMAG